MRRHRGDRVAIRTIIQPTSYISHDPRHLYASVREHREQVRSTDCQGGWSAMMGIVGA